DRVRIRDLLGAALAVVLVSMLLDLIDPCDVACARERAVAVDQRHAVLRGLRLGLGQARAFDLLRVNDRADRAADHPAPLRAYRAADEPADGAADDTADSRAAHTTLHTPMTRRFQRASSGKIGRAHV